MLSQTSHLDPKKQKELDGFIDKAERNQLQKYLHQRTSTVDTDIRDLRRRLDHNISEDHPLYGELVHPRGNVASLGTRDAVSVQGSSPKKGDQQRSGRGLTYSEGTLGNSFRPSDEGQARFIARLRSGALS